MDNFLHLVFESVFMGLILVALMFIAIRLYKPESFRDYYLAVFLAGVFGHIVLEIIGANQYYCTYGRACKTNQ